MKRLLPVFLVFAAALSLAPAEAPGQAPPDPNQAKLDELRCQQYLEQLKSADSIRRAEAIEKLRGLGLGEATEPLLRQALKEKYAYLATLAAESAAHLDPAAAFTLAKALVNENQGGSALTRRNLVLILLECPEPEAAELLLDRFGKDPSRVVRLEVIRAVGYRNPKKGVDYVKSALASRDFEERNVAATAAARLKAPELATPLFAGMDVTDEFHCMFAARALTRIQDPSVFGRLVANLGSGSGVPGEARAKVLEGSAMSEHVDQLISVLQTSRSRVFVEAAAVALGRLGARSASAQEALFRRMLRDRNREVRGACWHALSRIGNEAIVPTVLKKLDQRDAELLKYVMYLIGDLKIRDPKAMLVLRKVMLNERRNPMLRYAAAINYWRAADGNEIRKFEEKLIEGGGGNSLEYGIEAVGFRRNPKGFRFLLRLLKAFRDGSREEFWVEKALERMTGHFLGPYPGIWRKWFERYPDYFTPKQTELERNKWRKDFDKENKGWRQTEETERAVQLALEFLARHQHPDGRFDPQHFHKICPDKPPCRAEGARIEFDPTGTTALCVLAFLGAGYTPESGKYKYVIDRALEYLLAREQANGNFKTNDLVGGYDRPISAQAFAEACILSGDEELAWAAQRALDFLTTIQNKLGGWRYRVNIETTDTSCMSWNLFALKTGQKAGLQVKEIALAGCYRVMDMFSTPVTEHREEFIDIDPDYGYEVGRDTKYTYETGYQNPVWDTKYATVPLGLMCRIFLGWRRSHPFCIGSANKVLKDMLEPIPKGENWSLYRSFREYPTYAWYYGTLAMHQMGGRYFRLWNERIKKVVPGTQEKTGCIRGSWPMWNHDSINGRIVTAAFGALTLETYYRYLPVLQD